MREQKFSVGDSSLNTRKAKTLQFDTVVWEAVKSTVIRTFFFIFFRAELKLDTTWMSQRPLLFFFLTKEKYCIINCNRILTEYESL